MKASRFGEYALKGNYHIDLDPNWPYLPVYLEKMAFVHRFLDQHGQASKIIDLGCGEGALVQHYRQRGYDIIGIDANYESEYVLRGDILQTGYPDQTFDFALCLDVIEHLTFAEQEKAIVEIARIVRPGGSLLMTVPNLAHLASRLSFLVRGRFIRTSSIQRHPGDRPISEYLALLSPYFRVNLRRGIFPTFPLISILTVWKPSKVLFLHRLYNRLLAYPNFCFLNIIVCTRKPT